MRYNIQALPPDRSKVREPFPGAGVLVSHPGTQHSAAVARALHAHDLLQVFATGISVSPTVWPFSALRVLPPRIRTRVISRVGRRIHAIGLDAQVITPGAWPILLKLLQVTLKVDAVGHAITHLEDAAFDRWVSTHLAAVRPRVVHAFEGAAIRSFTRAHALGVGTVLDVGSDHTGYLQILGQEQQMLRGSDNSSPPRPRMHVYAERAVADHILVPSEHVRQALVRDGTNPDTITVIPYGVDSAFFLDRSPSPEPSRTFRAVFVGRASYRKGILTLLECWRNARLPDAELHVVGGIDTLIQQRMQPLPESVILHGNLPAHRVRERLQTADVFLFPSLMEGSALVIYEAMASGLPVITTEEAGSVVRDGIDGFIVPAGDAGALGDRLRAFYDDRALARRMGESGRRYVSENYTWGHYGQRLAHFYRRRVLKP